jgi:CubicO group peptidase (beta-lactamase class C family)
MAAGSKDLDTPVFTFFPEHADLRTPAKDRITLAHLLTMSSELVWDEYSSYSDPANSERLMDDSPDPYRYVLERALATTPGQFFNYSGGATRRSSRRSRKRHPARRSTHWRKRHCSIR